MASKESDLIKPPSFKSPEIWLRIREQLKLDSITLQTRSDISKKILRVVEKTMNDLNDYVKSLPPQRYTGPVGLDQLAFYKPELFMIYKALGKFPEAQEALENADALKRETRDIAFLLKASAITRDFASELKYLEQIKDDFRDDPNRPVHSRFLPTVSSYLPLAFYAWMLGDGDFAREVHVRAIKENEPTYEVYEKLLECVLKEGWVNHLDMNDNLMGVLGDVYGMGGDGLLVRDTDRYDRNVIEVNVALALILVTLAGINPRDIILGKYPPALY
jgi:tetratricopeptide (TPR) repeat protein